MIAPVPSEHQEQVAVVQWCAAHNIIAVAVSNGFHANGKRDKRFYGMIASLKAEGYSKGFPDLIIIIPNGGVIFIEMKRQKNSTTSKEQKEWSVKLEEAGCCSVICKGADHAIQEIKDQAILFKKGVI